MCCAAFYFICGNHLHDVQVYIGVPAENIFVDLFRALDGHDSDGHLAALKQVGSLMDRSQGFSGILPINC